MPLAPKPGCTVLNAGDKVVFDFPKQAWIPDEEQELNAQFTGRATVLADVRFETRTGLRSDNAQLDVTERFNK